MNFYIMTSGGINVSKCAYKDLADAKAGFKRHKAYFKRVDAKIVYGTCDMYGFVTPSTEV